LHSLVKCKSFVLGGVLNTDLICFFWGHLAVLYCDSISTLSVPTGTIPIVSMAWHSMLQLLITLTKEGTVQVWRPRVVSNPNRPHMRANFFEAAGVEALDVPSILTQGGGGVVYPVPRIVDLLLHPKLNLATVLFAVSSTSLSQMIPLSSPTHRT
jgi:hypothetical protein